MATLTDAGVLAVTDQKWDMKVLQARYGKATILKNVLNESAIVEESGVIVHIASKPRVTGGTVNTDGSFTAEAITLTDVQVNVNQWRYVSHIITDKQSKQAFVDLETELPSQFGEKLSEFDEIDLADQFLDLTGFNGTAGVGIGTPGTGTDFEEDAALTAVKAARQRQIPLENMSWQLSVEAFYQGWLKKERFTSVMHTGDAKSKFTTGIYGFKQEILGIPAFESTLLNGASTVNVDTGAVIHGASGINVSGTTACALIHKEALAIAVQINGKYKKADMLSAQTFGTIVAGHILYGLDINRASHGVVLYIRNGA